MHPLLSLLLVAALIWLLFHLLGPTSDFRIVIRDGSVSIDGKAVAAKREAIIEFFVRDLPELRRARVQGSWRGRRLKLYFGGPVTASQRQRIRNFLLDCL